MFGMRKHLALMTLLAVIGSACTPGGQPALPATAAPQTVTPGLATGTAPPALSTAHATRVLPPLPSPTPQVTVDPALTRTIALPIVQSQPEATAQPAKAAAATPEPLPKISLRNQGINVADYSNMALPTDLGFGWVQVFNPPNFPINGFKILYRVPLGQAISGKQSDIDDWADALESLVQERVGIINAYSIGNEVNLSREWLNQQPDPLLYTKLLAVAYARVKQSDPDALVISSGIAPTGGDGEGFMDDLSYARAMFDAGALDVLDGYGFHPYGFAYEPERDPADTSTKGLLFRRAEAHRKLMLEYGAVDKQMWATEFGWLIDPKEENASCTLPGLDWQRVSRDKQAAYVVRAYDYASKNWAWMGPMFLWNLDFSRSPLYPDACEQMKWFSLLDLNGNERPIVTALRNTKQ